MITMDESFEKLGVANIRAYRVNARWSVVVEGNGKSGFAQGPSFTEATEAAIGKLRDKVFLAATR